MSSLHELLQVDAELAVGACHDVGANAALQRHVAAGIGDTLVAAVVADCYADL
jgi:hypothetical protein